MRPGDVVGRFGGDEFVVLCEEVESLDAATAVAGRIASTLEAPFKVDGHDIHVGVSIGIAFADEAADAEEILRDADAAMYRAKSGGRGQWVVFDEELRRTAVVREQVEADLRSSHGGDSMVLHYQPIADCSTQHVHGVEALLRWHRNGELVTPEVFMQVAEETGLITSIGEWVIGEACAQLARWAQRSGWSGLRVSVNVSARQIQRPGFVAMVKATIDDAGVDPTTLCLEMTETVLVGDELNAAGALEELRGLGVSVAIDDFGTGYSSLTYLHRLPVDVVKLDRSFVEGICTDAQKRSIVEAVVNLCEALGLSSVAEGVETDEELDVLRALGCNSAQGNLLSPALPVGSLEQLMRLHSGELVLRMLRCRADGESPVADDGVHLADRYREHRGGEQAVQGMPRAPVDAVAAGPFQGGVSEPLAPAWRSCRSLEDQHARVGRACLLTDRCSGAGVVAEPEATALVDPARGFRFTCEQLQVVRGGFHLDEAACEGNRVPHDSGGSTEKNTGSPTRVAVTTPNGPRRGGGDICRTGGGRRVAWRRRSPASTDAPSTEVVAVRGLTLIVSATPSQIRTVSSQ
ncbi:MAG: bifunctional diguanylate cyclase/phosphodiesterase [Microthrixaceae bacterium]|nr:bifunctional diguanylate cyclase/phosphodiesterase [Microthrixaceae bacterium]